MLLEFVYGKAGNFGDGLQINAALLHPSRILQLTLELVFQLALLHSLLDTFKLAFCSQLVCCRCHNTLAFFGGGTLATAPSWTAAPVIRIPALRA